MTFKGNIVYIVYGKDSCPHCVSAVELLKSKNEGFVYKRLNVDYTKEELVEEMGLYGVTPRTVPQIVASGSYIGGFDQLKKHFEEK